MSDLRLTWPVIPRAINLHCKRWKQEESARLFWAFDLGEVCYSTWEISPRETRLYTLTTCLVKGKCHSVKLCQWFVANPSLEWFEAIHDDPCMTSTTAHIKIPCAFCPIWIRLKALSTLCIVISWRSSSEPLWHMLLIVSTSRKVHSTSGLSRSSRRQSHDWWWQFILLWYLFMRPQSWSPCLQSLMTKSRGQTISTTIHFPQSFKGNFFSRQSSPACASTMPLIMASTPLWKLRVVLPFPSLEVLFASWFMAPERPRFKLGT